MDGTEGREATTVENVTLPGALMWSKDAPLFIDEVNLARFYDSVVRPTFKETGPREIKLNEDEKTELRGALKGAAKIQLPSWLSSVLTVGGEGSGEGEVKKGKGNSTASTFHIEEIKTAPRQLEQITAVYLLRRRERLLYGSHADVERWHRTGEAQKVPRALAFVDLPRVKMIPMAAEFSDGKVVTLFDKFRGERGAVPPDYSFETKLEYWLWFDQNFSPSVAMNAVETAASEHGKIE